jgi:hypothetical protein
VRLKLNHWQYKTLSPSHAAKRTLTNNTTNQTTLKNPTTSHYHCWFTSLITNTKVSNTIYTLSIFMFFYLIFNYTFINYFLFISFLIRITFFSPFYSCFSSCFITFWNFKVISLSWKFKVKVVIFYSFDFFFGIL